jgi:RNA polymerase sigma-70 factor (ECF subfamily)
MLDNALGLTVATRPGTRHPRAVLVPSAQSDLDALRRMADGDVRGLGELYDRHAPTLLGLGVRILRSQREAEDLVHDVFLEAFQHAGDYVPERASVKGWLLLRMRSRCLDRVRSPGFARAEPLTEDPRADGGAGSEHRIDAARVRALLGALPGSQREVLELGYFEGLSFSEIAGVLGVPLGTVKSRVNAALGTLRGELGILPAEMRR